MGLSPQNDTRGHNTKDCGVVCSNVVQHAVISQFTVPLWRGVHSAMPSNDVRDCGRRPPVRAAGDKGLLHLQISIYKRAWGQIYQRCGLMSQQAHLPLITPPTLPHSAHSPAHSPFAKQPYASC
jgi:hypothetical protein